MCGNHQLFSELMGTTMSQDDHDFIDQPSEDADLRAVELSNVSCYGCVGSVTR